MKRGRGRPLKVRTDTELLDYLEAALGFGRSRSTLSFTWDGHQLVVAQSGEELGRGLDLRRSVSHAVSMRYRRPS